MSVWGLWALLALQWPAAVSGQDAQRLFEDLLSGYNRLSRPVRKDSDQLHIQFKLKLLQILDVHEKKQIVATNGWLIHIWSDYRLAWSPYEYGNLTVMHIPAELIWLPDIILYNNADGSPQVTTLTKAHVYASGQVVWEPPVIYNSMCEISIQHFPLDEQFCKMKFGSWTYYGSQVDLRHLQTDAVVEMEGEDGERVWTVALGIDINEYQESVEWDLMTVQGTRHEKWYPCCDYPYVDITYYINIRRKTLFYTVNLIVPCVGITFLTCLVFYLPSDSNNKISLCVSVLVSLTVFFLLLIEIIPPTSLVVPLIGRYLLFTMVSFFFLIHWMAEGEMGLQILVSFSVCITVVVINVHYPCSGNVFPVPGWARWLFLRVAPRYVLCQALLLEEMEKRIHSRLFCMSPPQLRYDPSRIAGAQRNTAAKKPSPAATSAVARTASPSGRASPLRSVAQTAAAAAARRDPAAKTYANINYIAAQIAAKEQEENLKEEWKYVAMVLDRAFFIVFTGTIVVGTSWMLLSSPVVWDTRVPVTQLLKQARAGSFE